MSHTPMIPDKPAFNRAQFVDRPELPPILNAARRIALQEPVERRAFLIHGQRGAGKSWLLNEAAARVEDHGFSACFLALAPDSDVKAIRGKAAGQKRPLLLAVDVNGVGNTMLDELAEDVLAPLVEESNVLIAVAERGRGHYWAIPNFRDKSVEIELKPFLRQGVEELVKRQVPGSTATLDRVMELGGGYPWSTYILARYLPQGEPLALSMCVRAFLQCRHDALCPYFTARTDDEPCPDQGLECLYDDTLCPYFIALSPLRAFDEDRMVPLLRAFCAEWRQQKWPYRDRRALRERLLATKMAFWPTAAGGYVIDEPLRRVLEAGLRAGRPALWRALHQAAYEQYDTWAREQSKPNGWLAEKQYHEQLLDSEGEGERNER